MPGKPVGTALPGGWEALERPANPPPAWVSRGARAQQREGSQFWGCETVFISWVLPSKRGLFLGRWKGIYPWNFIHSFIRKHFECMLLFFLFLFLFLAMLRGLQDLSSPTRDWTLGPWQWKCRVLTTEPPGISLSACCMPNAVCVCFVLCLLGFRGGNEEETVVKKVSTLMNF